MHRFTVPIQALLLAIILLSLGCMAAPPPPRRMMEVTAYCPCGECNGWYRGRWLYLKLNFWNRYYSDGPNAGQPHSGRSASGERLRTPNPGLLSWDSISHPWRIPIRVLPWNILPHKGTIAADTQYYPFGTEIYVPGWGWGVVEDRGSAIKGPERLDILYRWHWQANRWGRQQVVCTIVRQPPVE